MEITHAFRAMNTDVQVTIVAEAEEAAGAAAAEVQAVFAETERTLSRFLPESELSALNRAAGRPFHASELLLRVVDSALAAARDTGGLFDPTVLKALIAAGYDRSFELLNKEQTLEGEAPALEGEAPALEGEAPAEPSWSPLPPSPTRPTSWRDVTLDRHARTITLPRGLGLDLGGIGKGWTVDRSVDLLRPFRNFAVDAGGDIYAAGAQGDGTPWTVGIEDPAHPGSDLAVLAVDSQAVVTSTTRRRRWLQAGAERHHLIDPRTGSPSDSDVVSVTAIAGSVARAETLAKAALLLGWERGAGFLERHGAEGLLVLNSGDVKLTRALRKELSHV